jgi:homoserine dehydrogenase
MENILVKLKENIEELSFFHQVEVLRILNETNSSILNENKNGVFVNLTQVDNEVVSKLDKYLKYVLKQEKHIVEFEKAKKKISEQFFNEDPKDEIFSCNKV